MSFEPENAKRRAKNDGNTSHILAPILRPFLPLDFLYEFLHGLGIWSSPPYSMLNASLASTLGDSRGSYVMPTSSTVPRYTRTKIFALRGLAIAILLASMERRNGTIKEPVPLGYFVDQISIEEHESYWPRH